MLRSLTLAHGGNGCLAPAAAGPGRRPSAPAHHHHHHQPLAPKRRAATLLVAAALSGGPVSSSSAAAAAAAPVGTPVRLPRLAALDRPQSLVLVAARAQPLQRLRWHVGCDGCALEVWYRPAAAAAASLPVRPPVLLVHGLFRAAWSWEESFMPALSASGRASYAVSLRGQGGSQLAGTGEEGEQGVASSSRNTNTNNNNNRYPRDVAAAVQEAGGVPLDVVMADLEAVVARVAQHHAEETRRWRSPLGEGTGAPPAAAATADDADADTVGPHAPVLVGHSLGGMFVQEYLARLQARPQQQQQQQQQQQEQEQKGGGGSIAGSPPRLPSAPLPPPISGAALLASATAGTVMDFGRFVSDVGLPEFLWQMWIVATGQHLRDLSVARYCWWPDEQQAGGGEGAGGGGGEEESGGGVSNEQARRWHALVASSSRACPYVRGEVTSWNPPPRDGGDGSENDSSSSSSSSIDSLGRRRRHPPVFALGGARDRIIRPWQVDAARAHWGADVAVIPELTHDVMLGPQAGVALDALVGWLEERVEAPAAASASARR